MRANGEQTIPFIRSGKLAAILAVITIVLVLAAISCSAKSKPLVPQHWPKYINLPKDSAPANITTGIFSGNVKGEEYLKKNYIAAAGFTTSLDETQLINHFKNELSTEHKTVNGPNAFSGFMRITIEADDPKLTLWISLATDASGRTIKGAYSVYIEMPNK